MPLPAAIPFFPPFDFEQDFLVLWGADRLHDTGFTILMGLLVAVACGWLGCWMILQGLALVGDAISHTVLLGIVVAFLLTGSVSGIGMFVAATLTGLITVVLIDLVHHSSRLKEDAAIGIVFTSLFALGVVLLAALAGRAHIDTRHVLYGDLEFVALGESLSIGGVDVPLPVCQMAVVVAALFVLIVAFYKELVLTAFDPQLAASLGIRPLVYRYGMLAALSLVAVGSFRAVGAVLVVGMLIAPAATAYLLTRRLPLMFVISAAVGAVSSVAGYHLSYWLSVSAAGAMVCSAATLFGLAFLFAPEQGVLSALWRRTRVRWRTTEENIIRRIWKLSGGRAAGEVEVPALASALALPAWWFSLSLRALVGRGWIEAVSGVPPRVRLTPIGSAQARRLDRAHRLWETYLVDKVGLPSDHVHPAAEEVEHVLTEQLIERLDDALGHPDTDPHGAPIPRSPVSDQAPGTFTLSKLRVGDEGRIAGVVDDRSSAAAATPADPRLVEISTLGLTLGQRVEVLSRDPSGRTWTVRVERGRPVEVPHLLADAILVRLSEPARE